MPTRADVAAAAGVSPTTVSYVLAGRGPGQGIATTTCERVRAAAERLGYVPHPAAREMRGASCGRVGLVIGGFDRPFIDELAKSFHRAAAARGLGMLLALGRERVEQLRATLAHCDAAIVLGAPPAHWVPEPRPVVFVHEQAVPGAPTLVSDSAGLVHAATTHLLAQGWSDLWFSSTNPARVPGFVAALEEAGLPADPARLVCAGACAFADGAAVADAVRIEPGRTGIVAANDAVAMGCMQALARRGLRAGRDYGIVGFDGIEAGAWLEVPLSSVHWRYDALAEQALAIAQAARGSSDGGASTSPVPSTLTARASSVREEIP